MSAPGQDGDAPSAHRLPALLRQERASAIDFGDLAPEYHAPMHYPTEVDLYEPSLSASDMPTPQGAGQQTLKAEVEVHLPCGYFNIWRRLHDRRAPVAPRLARFFVGSAAPLQHDGRPAVAPENAWDSRISYSSADDEYYENGHALPSIKGWDHGMMCSRGLFRKVEHDWMMAYLAPVATECMEPKVAVWRFNYVESRRVIDRFHAVLGFTLFSETSGVEWCIRPLSQRSFRKVPMRILSAAEAQCFPELADAERRAGGDGSLEARAQVVAKYRGRILAHRMPGDEFNSYIVQTIPGLAADLSEYVAGEHGFELAAVITPAAEGPDRWQKAQIARQNLRLPVSGRMREGDDALARCGLDFRVSLRDEIPVPPSPAELVRARGSGDARRPPLRMAGAGCDFTIRVRDPENTVGSLQPPIRAHECVLRAGSEYFAALLASAMAEASAKEVQLDSMPYGPVRLAISFLYTDAIPAEDSMDLAAWVVLLGVASRLQMPRLLQLCQAHILCETLAVVAADTAPAAGSESPAVSYRDQAECPDTETIESLRAVADETGAHDLLQALDRLVAYCLIAICESRIRNGPPDEFRARPAQHSGWQLLPDIGPHHLLHPHPLGLHRRDFELAGDETLLPLEHAFMPGPVVHPELIPAHRRENGLPVEPGGIIGRFLGNWRIVGAPADPPPMPGVAPETPPHVPRPEPEPEADGNGDAA
ncbi:Peptide-N(4)-(N-acetyl-beta- glucosaminyl)asparagine amidase [Coemansia biformis]|uniref:Peptide-N(4)-(N-acetyl-beta-glucosaminyl)asparagine amidase n=1 Tax=Coemansia biformis TaxID=1286918 RepID=A0A9W7YAX8_9FUNG|nr:Peptide-N(4)-(N-acetyl-beta- glucosaminyl)asparagine amidase [Coemansia biformis]